VQIVMIVIAGAAAHLGHLAVQHRNHGVVCQPPALDTMIVDNIAQT